MFSVNNKLKIHNHKKKFGNDFIIAEKILSPNSDSDYGNRVKQLNVISFVRESKKMIILLVFV